MSNLDFKEIYNKTQRMKIDILMQEPCPIYEGPEDGWEDYSYQTRSAGDDRCSN
jgi:hypothetical protein